MLKVQRRKERPFMKSNQIGRVTAGLVIAMGVVAARAQTMPESRSRDPYVGAIAVDAATGAVLREDRADEKGHPASMLKLMTLFVVLDEVRAGTVKLDDSVRITAEAARIGGSQVYLAEGEVFPVEELVHALMTQSANDAALALALHVAGSRDAFLQKMNRKARALRMDRTVFHSVHGLPPGSGQAADWTTARDFAVLCRALLAEHPGALAYTSVRERTFRPDKPFVMRTHNRLLASVEGCDGLKTGFYRVAGYSIAATAQRDGARAIVVVLGSTERVRRDDTARAWLNEALAGLRSAAAASVTAPVSLPPPLPAPLKP
jgi:serine-type D-Ala-D-Ala carboxypeptidase (penicillin-binding protein 5/6)